MLQGLRRRDPVGDLVLDVVGLVVVLSVRDEEAALTQIDHGVDNEFSDNKKE